VVKQTESDWVVIGRFGKVHGLKGLISVISFTDPIENIFEYEPLHITLKRSWCPIKLLHKQISGDKLLVQVENYLTREDVSLLTNTEIAVPRQALPRLDENEYYLHDLIGLKVYNLQNEFLGTVTEILPTAANDVIVVSGATRLLIPFIWEHFIIKVELPEKRMTVAWELDELEP
jgi:16S rRNA processing protein RimM